MPVGKDILILGSSRSLQISSEWFQPRSLFNAAVFGGDLDDMISLFQLCLEGGKTPRVVVLEVNPSLTNERKGGELRSLQPAASAGLWRVTGFALPFAPWPTVFGAAIPMEPAPPECAGVGIFK